MLTIIDYGVGNISAIQNVYKQLNIPTNLAKQPNDLLSATKLILPGVGAFDSVMKKLKQSAMLELLNEVVLNKKIPVLGICVGMQILASGSEEGELAGLGWIKGTVKKFPNQLRLPHMGWNSFSQFKNNNLFKSLDMDLQFYFLHSYYFACESAADILAHTKYDFEFASVVNNANIYGVQFHPEKSHRYGTTLLKNFAEIN